VVLLECQPMHHPQRLPSTRAALGLALAISSPRGICQRLQAQVVAEAWGLEIQARVVMMARCLAVREQGQVVAWVAAQAPGAVVALHALLGGIKSNHTIRSLLDDEVLRAQCC